MPTRLRSRNDTAANWTASNPILSKGELGLESDTNQFKFGDGVKAWSALTYAGGGGGTVPTDILRLSTPGVVVYQADNSVVGTAFVMAGFYQRTASGWTFPYWLQQRSFERFVVNSFPYTLTAADLDLGMVFLQPAADASVVLPSGLLTNTAITGVRTYQDVVFYLDAAVTVTFTPASGVSLFVSGTLAAAASYALKGPRKTVVLQARASDYRVLD
jgi:hypothetical protein